MKWEREKIKKTPPVPYIGHQNVTVGEPAQSWSVSNKLARSVWILDFE